MFPNYPGHHRGPLFGRRAAGQRFADEGQRDEEVHLADGYRKGGQGGVIVVFGHVGVEIVGYPFTARCRLQDSLDQGECGPFGLGEVRGFAPGRDRGDAFLGFTGGAQIARVQDGQVGAADDLAGAQLDQADRGRCDRSVRRTGAGVGSRRVRAR